MVVGRRLREVESAEEQTFVGTSSRWVTYFFGWAGVGEGRRPSVRLLGRGKTTPAALTHNPFKKHIFFLGEEKKSLSLLLLVKKYICFDACFVSFWGSCRADLCVCMEDGGIGEEESPPLPPIYSSSSSFPNTRIEHNNQ